MSIDIDILRKVVARFQIGGGMAHRVASQFFEDRYAKLLVSMSLQEAKSILGFPPGASPSPEEIAKAYKVKVFENHPDRGGDPTKMVEVNVAKDVLDGKGRSTWRPEPAPRREQPKVEQDAVIEGQSFEAAMSDSGVPAGVEWKFVSIAEFYWEQSYYPSHRVWVLYGQTDTKHIFLALKNRGESAGLIPTPKGKNTKVEEDWQSSMVDIPIAQNVAKIAPKYIKEVGVAWTDAKPKPPRKFIAWPGGKPTEAIMKKIPRSGGAALKDILVGTGLLNDEDPSVSGRKSVVEIYTKSSRERLERMKKLKAEGKVKSLDSADHYDFFVRVNGKTEQLEDETIAKMKRSFIPWVLKWEVSEGAPKNLTRMRGSPGGRGLTFPASAAINELVNCLTGEPSWLHIALEKAAEEYEENTKTAALRELRSRYSLFETAKIADVEPYEVFKALLALA